MESVMVYNSWYIHVSMVLLVKLKRHEDKGEMDLWSYKQSTLPSKIDKMKGMTIEMTFEYPGVDGAKCLDWYQGRIIKFRNERNSV